MRTLQTIYDQDRGRFLHAFENDDADYIAVTNALGIEHSTSRRLPITCVLVDAGSWQRVARKNGKVDDAKRQEPLINRALKSA